MNNSEFIYQIYDGRQLIFSGTSDEVAERFNIKRNTVNVAFTRDRKLNGKYIVKRKRITGNVVIHKTVRVTKKQDEILNRMCELYYDTTGECPLDLTDEFRCPFINKKCACDMPNQAPLCWNKWAKNF